MSNIVARTDPYTVVIIPEIRGPVSYLCSGFKVSVGELAKVDHAEVIPKKGSGVTIAPGTSGVRLFVTYVSGNIVTVDVWPGNLIQQGPLALPGATACRFSGMGLSHVAFGLKTYGH